MWGVLPQVLETTQTDGRFLHWDELCNIYGPAPLILKKTRNHGNVILQVACIAFVPSMSSVPNGHRGAS